MENNNKRVNLFISYKEKDVAKQLGAKWDAKGKQWYTTSNNSNKRQLLKMSWQHLEQQPGYLNNRSYYNFP